MATCECHFEATDSHDGCCGHEDGRNPDCPIHGDGSGPNAIRRPFTSEQRSRRTLPEALDAAKDGTEFGQVLQGLFSALEEAMDGDDQ